MVLSSYFITRNPNPNLENLENKRNDLKSSTTQLEKIQKTLERSLPKLKNPVQGSPTSNATELLDRFARSLTLFNQNLQPSPPQPDEHQEPSSTHGDDT